MDRRRQTRKIAGYASALLIIDTSFTVFNEIDVLLIGALLSAPFVGFFNAPMRLVTFLYYPSYAWLSVWRLGGRLGRAAN